MVHVVLVDVGDHGVQHAPDVLLLEAQAQAVATELRAVHAATGVARLRIADADPRYAQMPMRAVWRKEAPPGPAGRAFIAQLHPG